MDYRIKILICIIVCLFMYLLLLHYVWQPNPELLVIGDLKTLHTEMKDVELRLSQCVYMMKGGMYYILDNSNLNLKESHQVFLVCLDKSYKYDIPIDLLLKVIKIESHFNQTAISNKGAMGIMQIMPLTAVGLCKELDLSYNKNKLFDLEFNMELGTFFLHSLYVRYGSWGEALSHYNSGTNNNVAYLELLKK